MAEHDLEFRDFSLPGARSKPKRFKIDDDIFVAPPVVPPLTLAEMAGLLTRFASQPDPVDEGETVDYQVDAGNLAETITAFADVFEMLLIEDENGVHTGTRFKERLLSRKEPIDLKEQAIPALEWLLEVYGLRPKEPSSSSANGSDGAGTGSTDGAPSVE